MTVNTQETKASEPTKQEKVSVEPNASQKNIDINLSQNKQDTIAAQPTTPETEGDPNWRAFRDARKKDRAEREAAERRASEKEVEITALKAAMEAAFTKGGPSPQAYQQYYGTNQDPVDETEEQKIERIVNARLEKKEQEYEKKRMEREQSEYPTRLVKDFPDFNQVISQENRDYLDYHYPEVSRPLSRLNDGYDKWHDIYYAIKKLVPNNANAKKEAAKADINMAKPKSISSTGLTQSQSTPGSHILSEDRKASNWARMQQHLKGVG